MWKEMRKQLHALEAIMLHWCCKGDIVNRGLCLLFLPLGWDVCCELLGRAADQMASCSDQEVVRVLLACWWQLYFPRAAQHPVPWAEVSQKGRVSLAWHLPQKMPIASVSIISLEVFAKPQNFLEQSYEHMHTKVWLCPSHTWFRASQ